MKNIIKFTFFILILIVVLNLLSIMYVDTRNEYRKLRQFYKEPQNSFDVLILGPSLTMGAVIPSVLWEEAGITSFNLSFSAAPPAAQYFWLKEALQYHSPSVVIVSARYIIKEEDDFDDNETRYRQGLDPMRLSLNKINSVREIVSNSTEQTIISYIFPIFRYHDNEEVSWSNLDTHNIRERSTTFGCTELKRYTKITTQEHPEESEDVYSSPDFQLQAEYLSKMIDLCKKNKIDVILIEVPDAKKNSAPMSKKMQEYAEEKGVKLINFRYDEPYQSTKIDFKTDFYSASHVNISGGTKISCYLANYISENYNVPDRRKENNDSHWEVVVKQYHERYKKYLENLEYIENQKLSESWENQDS